MTTDIAIIGAGFSGSLLALQILRLSADTRVFLLERAETFGRGLAYGASDPGHLLNVRATNMSAFPDDPDHFVEWLRLTTPADKAPAFVSRQLYGTYLQALLGGIVQTARGAGRIVAIGDEAVSATFDGPRPSLRLAVGRDLEADHIVLATGNLPPHDLACFVGADPAIYVSDPWEPGAFDDWRPLDDVLLVGTGLTAVDMVLRLQSLGHKGSIAALSRRGLRPRRHVKIAPEVTPWPVPPHPTLTALLRLVRQEVAVRDWHQVIDGLRPSVQRLWREASDGERRRFLRHLRPWWDVHRHRIAPVVADIIEDLERRDHLTFLAGRIEGVERGARDVAVKWRPRGAALTRSIHVQRIVNCTGPAGDLTRARSPLIRDLLERGLARPDARGLGLEVDADCHVVDAAGQAQPRLLAVGPMSRGAFWEITSVPDIRIQAARIAAHLAGEARDPRPDRNGR